jgi:hypothetical protein
MTLFQRYKRLTLWNKLGVIASIVGILAFILAIITLLIPERSKPVAIQWNTNALDKEVSGVIEKAVANLKKSENSAAFSDTNYPGLAFVLFLKIESQTNSTTGYLLDIEGKAANSRVSLYVDANQNLCFKIIDEDSQSLLLKVPQGLDTFMFDNAFVLFCEYASATNSSFIRMNINGKVVAEKDLSQPFLSQPFIFQKNGQGLYLGNDATLKSGARFYLSDLIIYTNTFTAKNKIDLLTYFNNKINHR